MVMVSRGTTLISPSIHQAVEERNVDLRPNANALNVPNPCYTFLRVDGWKSEYISVDSLLRHLSRKCKSEASRRAYLSRLYSFCLYAEIDPDRLITLPKELIEKQVQDYADQFNDGKHSLRYMNNIINLLRAFFIANGFKGAQALEVEGYHVPARYRKRPEYIPKKNEVYLMADSACSLRDRAIILADYSTGIRSSSLRALLIRDVEAELFKGVSNLLIPIYPEMKLIEPYACKGNIPYFTFTCDEATEAIRLYLRERREEYGNLLSHEPLFASEYNQISRNERKSTILSTRQLQNVVKSAAQRAGLPQWQHVTPYSLRKAFETVLHSELIDGGRMDGKIQEFFMGHILPGSQDAYFNKTDIAMLRDEYAKLNFGRIAVENKFKILRMAVARAFKDTGLDGEKIMEEYVKIKRNI
jgi:integrase